MTEEDQIAVVTKVLRWRRAESNLQEAIAKYDEILFSIRRSQLAKEWVHKQCHSANEDLLFTANEMLKKYLQTYNRPTDAFQKSTILSQYCFPQVDRL